MSGVTFLLITTIFAAARYRNDTDQAHMYYNHAVTLIPTNGQPYNQLAIVSASKSDQLSMAFYYIRSIAVKHPFPAALTNLQSTFSKLVDRSVKFKSSCIVNFGYSSIFSFGKEMQGRFLF